VAEVIENISGKIELYSSGVVNGRPVSTAIGSISVAHPLVLFTGCWKIRVSPFLSGFRLLD
jgi:hypothetical protein